jgi:hypothetical protein
VGNHDYVGGYIGIDDAAGQEFLRGKLDKQKAIARAIRDPDFPLHLALNVAKIHVLPRPIFYLRCLPYRVTRAPLHEFDADLRAAILRRTGLPHDLPPSALLSLLQPVGNGGIGLRSLADICCAGKWSAAAAVAADVQDFVEESDEPLPFVRDRKAAYRDLVDAGARALDESFTSYYDVQLNDDEKKAWGPYVDARLQYLPSSPANIHTFYKGERVIRSLQFMLSRVMAKAAFDRFLESSDCSASDRIRLTSCRSKESSRWLMPHALAPPLPDPLFRIALRLRMGLPPFAYDLPACPLCNKGAGDAWHPFACAAVRRRMVTTRHDRAMDLVCRYARSCSVIARLEPKDFKSLVPDAELFFSSMTVLCDLSGVHSLSPTHLAASARPGLAMGRRATAKHSKYDAHASATDSSFYPLVVDCFGTMHEEFSQLLDLVDEEAGLAAFAPTPGRMTRDDFLAVFASQWQRDNAHIVLQWQRMCRMHLYSSRQ